MQYLVGKVLCLRNYMDGSSQLLLTGKSLRSECSGHTVMVIIMMRFDMKMQCFWYACEIFKFAQLHSQVQLLLTGKSLRSECSGRTHSSHSQLIGLMRAIMAIMAICSQGKPGVTFGNILTQSHLSQNIVKLVQKHQKHDSAIALIVSTFSRQSIVSTFHLCT